MLNFKEKVIELIDKIKICKLIYQKIYTYFRFNTLWLFDYIVLVMMHYYLLLLWIIIKNIS